MCLQFLISCGIYLIWEMGGTSLMNILNYIYISYLAWKPVCCCQSQLFILLVKRRKILIVKEEMKGLAFAESFFFNFPRKITSVKYKFMNFYVFTSSFNEEAENHFKLRKLIWSKYSPCFYQVVLKILTNTPGRKVIVMKGFIRPLRMTKPSKTSATFAGRIFT